MPTSKFFNLSQEKRNKIIKAAKNEFAENSFYDASINRIIKEADISRGAFYIYFENKEDLFIYIMNENRDKVLKEIIGESYIKNYDVFELAFLVFNYVTDEKQTSELKKLFCVSLTRVDMNLILNCINYQDNKKEAEIIKKYTDIKKLNINSDEELIYISELICSQLIMEMIYVFSKRNTVSQSRYNLEKKFQFIKNGVQ